MMIQPRVGVTIPARPRAAQSESSEFYADLLSLKRTFTGGSEHRVIADLTSTESPSRQAESTLLDVGASDCRHTRKILNSTQQGIPGWRLITVDPDGAALACTPAGIDRLQHFPMRFEQLPWQALASAPDIILFSHSLYYLADPVAPLERAATLAENGVRIVISMWSRDCELRHVAAEMSGLPLDAVVSADELRGWVGHLGKVTPGAIWEGGVDLDLWRTDSRLMAGINRALRMTTGVADHAVVPSVAEILRHRGPRLRRINCIFSIEV